MDLPAALASSYRAFMDGRELKGAFLDGVERSWGQVEVARNLFTNPNLVGDGTWAEVRRNHVKAPRGEVAGIWTGQLGGYYTPSTLNGRSAALVTRGTSPSSFVSAAMPGMAGKKVYGSLVVAATPSSVGKYVNLFLYDGAGVTAININPKQLGAVDEEIRFTFESTRDTTGPLLLYVQSNGIGWVQGDTYKVTDVMVSDAPYPYFDGSTTPETAVGVDQPEDFRWRWLGTPNESESVMEAEQAREVAGGYTTTGWPEHESALRVTEQASFTAAPGETVAIIARHTGQILNGTDTVEGLNHAPGAPVMTLGPGDWALPTRVAQPDYTGTAFSGDTPDTDRDSYTWAGGRNNSPSIHRRYE